MPPKQTIDHENLEKLKRYLKTKPKMIILAHSSPDGDTLGGALGIYFSLKNTGQEVQVACIDKIPKKYQFLPGVEKIQTDFDENDFDTVIFVDCGNKKMTKFHETKPKIHSNKMVKINIDHHPSNDFFGEINFVSTLSCSSTEIIFELLKALELNITPQIATLLLLGIYTDTGNFMHQNTTPKSYLAASQLIKLGGNVSQIARNVFRNYELKTFKLWAKVLQNLHVTSDGAAIVGIEKKDYQSIGASRSDLEGVIDYINSMPEAKYSVLLSEDETGNVKASLRTRNEDVDVKALAEKFGGGGHIKASGFTIKGGRLEKEVKWKIIQE
ncbi:bifunctional oligoribonuclease/PAP phosphatase NrnA [Candidatus Gracilibacteria bacterium]|nr:bifunctional oligoribonuclease/PAP phosphatase NrnA [Candidatus Gracilibacteria bacterium]